MDAVAALAAGMIAACVAVVSVETPDGTRIPPELYPSTADVTRGILGPGVRRRGSGAPGRVAGRG